MRPISEDRRLRIKYRLHCKPTLRSPQRCPHLITGVWAVMDGRELCSEEGDVSSFNFSDHLHMEKSS